MNRIPGSAVVAGASKQPGTHDGKWKDHEGKPIKSVKMKADVDLDEEGPKAVDNRPDVIKTHERDAVPDTTSNDDSQSNENDGHEPTDGDVEQISADAEMKNKQVDAGVSDEQVDEPALHADETHVLPSVGNSVVETANETIVEEVVTDVQSLPPDHEIKPSEEIDVELSQSPEDSSRGVATAGLTLNVTKPPSLPETDDVPQVG